MKTYTKHKVKLADGKEVIRYNIPLKKGWTKEMVMDVIRKGNNNTQSLGTQVLGGLEDTACQYRSPQGNKCFIGCFIPDSKYTPEMERKGVRQLLHYWSDIKDDIPFEDALIPRDFGGTQNLYVLFQNEHDYHSNTSPTDLHTAAQNFLDNYFEDNP